jgi:hypothetical protein
MKTAYATIKGIEVMRALCKGQASAFYFHSGIFSQAINTRSDQKMCI